MKQFLSELTAKFFEREAYIPIALMAVATVALFKGRATFSEWASVSEVLAGIAVGGLVARKRLVDAVPVVSKDGPQ